MNRDDVSENPFYSRPPIFFFRFKLVIVLLPLICLSIMISDRLGQTSYNPIPKRLGENSSELVSSTGFIFYDQYFLEWRLAPEGCLSGNVKSEFQGDRCRSFWKRIVQASAIAVIPLVLFLFCYLLGMDSLKNTYRIMKRRVEKKSILTQGIATKPVKTGNDPYGLLYGLRKISLELKDKKQIHVYYPKDQRLPRPGDIVAVLSCGVQLGRERHYGAVLTS